MIATFRLAFALALLVTCQGSVSAHNESKILNILMVSDHEFGHMAPLLPVGEELAQRGHNVTMLLILSKSQQEKYRSHVEKYDIHLWNVSSEGLPQIDLAELTKQLFIDFFGSISTLVRFGVGLNGILAEHMNNTLSAGDWDFVIMSHLLQSLTACMHSNHDVPFVMIGHFPLAIHLHPSWPWPGPMQGAASDNMGFLDRALSIPYGIVDRVLMSTILYPITNSIVQYCPSVTFKKAASSPGIEVPVIVHSVIGFEYPGTITPLTEYVGALVSARPTPLTGQLEKWLETKSDRSVVYISMGSMFSLNQHSAKAFFEGVMKANFSILWSLRKSNQQVLEGIDIDPDRVLISEWTPQFSVLQSRSIHSAILHGGINGLCEALWNGVPVLVFPQMQEQLFNAGRVHFNGLGILLTADTLSSDKVTESLRALDAGEYRYKVAKLQKMYRLAGGVKRAADLVEFYEAVGYTHLVPAYAKYQWSWVQYYNADVYAVLVVTLAAVGMCCLACCKNLYRKCQNGVKHKQD